MRGISNALGAVQCGIGFQTHEIPKLLVGAYLANQGSTHIVYRFTRANPPADLSAFSQH